MYEFHGWIRLAESPSEIDEGELDSKCKKLQHLFSNINWSSGKAELLLLNGGYTVVLNGIPNRRRNEAEELSQIIDYIIKNFKGAYGLVYEYDEQTQTAAGHGVFSVKVIKRGRYDLGLDPFLSPLIPVVEDP